MGLIVYVYILPRQVQLHCTVQIQFCQPLKLIIDKFFHKLYDIGSNELQFVTKVQLLRRYTSFLVDFRTITEKFFMNLLPQKPRSVKITEKEELFLQNLFQNGGSVMSAAMDAGYPKGSVGWLKNKLADEIIRRSKNLLATASVKATNKLIEMIDTPEVNRGDDLRLKAAESLLNRVGLGKEETHNHNVQALHGVVLLPAKKGMEINGQS